MILSQSNLLGKTRKEVPKEAETASHKFLLKAGYINQLAAGVWSLLPLGFQTHKKIENIIREEMEGINGQEIFLPTLQPKNLWLETGRWDTIDPPLFKIKDRHKKEFGLGPTHEEVITDLARTNIASYKQLPMMVFQIQNKFRNEVRSSGGLLRVREFIMKDLYSFHQDEKDLDKYYKKVHAAYHRIFKRCGLNAVSVEAESGSIGGNFCHEFMVLADSGEDKVIMCSDCGWAANAEVTKLKDACPKCNKKTVTKKAIEAGHIFKLGDTYSKKMKATYLNKAGQQKPVVMGCYGIGLGRLMASIVEANHDNDGIIWPETVSPFAIHLLQLSTEAKAVKMSKQITEYCQKYRVGLLYDDRDLSPAQKLKDADLIGISLRLVVSQRSLADNKVEIKYRAKKSPQLTTLEELFQIIQNVK